MFDFNLKSEILNNGVYDFYKNCINASHLYYLLIEYCFEYPSYLIPYLDFPLDSVLSYSEIRECKRVFNANRQRFGRLKKYITMMIVNPCIFLTFTFSDKTLSSTNENTRRRYVRMFLSSFGVPAIANRDYGAEKGREHYHAIIQIPHIDYSLYKYGSLNGRRVIVGSDTDTRISKYIAKLTNHAIKETTKRSSLIYLNMNLL